MPLVFRKCMFSEVHVLLPTPLSRQDPLVLWCAATLVLSKYNYISNLHLQDKTQALIVFGLRREISVSVTLFSLTLFS